MKYLTEATTELTGLSEFPQYLTLLFEIDGYLYNDKKDGVVTYAINHGTQPRRNALKITDNLITFSIRKTGNFLRNCPFLVRVTRFELAAS